MLRACCVANKPRVGAAHFGGKAPDALGEHLRRAGA
jgi:hypothetical protein